VNTVWGNAASVLVGDYLYSRSFEMMVSVKNVRVMEILAATTTAIAEGEVLQLLNRNNPATTEQKYLEVISRKTAILFSAASQLGAVLAHASHDVEQALGRFGLHLGMAFQLIDDALDYKADPEKLGKNLGDDLAEGKPTLPLIYALGQSSRNQAIMLRKAIESGDREAFRDVYAVVKSTNAIAYTEMRAREEAHRAFESLETMPTSIYKEALITLVHFSVERNH
jgi:octaprenyl-diphosphate synthase